MLAYILRRLFVAIGTVWVISVVSFAIIQLPPGDYVTSYIAQLMSTGTVVTQEEAANLRAQYGLDQPVYVQYVKWMWQVLQGNFGVSMEWKRPVTEVIGDRLLLTALLAFTAVIFTWILAIPIGIYSAVRQYSVGDYVVTCMGFIGLAVPNFLLALVIMYLAFAYFGAASGACSRRNIWTRPGAGHGCRICSSICGFPAIILSTAVAPSSSAFCGPICSMNSANPMW
jgi:peptide/nickel transport system permease protein